MALVFLKLIMYFLKFTIIQSNLFLHRSFKACSSSVPKVDTKVSIGYVFAKCLLTDDAGQMDTKLKKMARIGYFLRQMDTKLGK